MAIFNFEEEKKTSTFNFEEKPTTFNFEEEPKVAATKPTPQQLERAVSVTPPVEGAGGAAFGVFPRASARKPVEAPQPTPSLTATEPKPKVATGKDFTALDAAVTQLTPKPKPSVTTAVEGAGGAAFGVVPKQAMGGRNEGLTPKMAAQSPEIVSFATEYFKSSRPNKPLPKDPVKLMEEFRSSFNRDTLDEVATLTRLANATPQQREMEVKARDVAKAMGGNVLETVATVVTDPFTYAGGVAGFAYKQMALRGTQSLARTQLKTVGVTAAVEGGVSGGINIVQQKQDVELALRDEVNYLETAVVAGLGMAVEGAIAAKTVASGGKRVSERIDDLKATAKPAQSDKATEDFKAKFAEKEKQIGAPLFESSAERQAAREATFDTVSPPTDTMESVLKKPIVDDIFKVARQLFTDNPELRPNLEEVRTVQGIVDALNVADEDVIQQAASRAGVKPADFLEMFKVQASEAGAFLQQAKSTADMLRKMTKGDPALEDAFTRMLNAGAGTEYLSGKVLSGIKTTTGASVGASTAGLSTAVMNAIGLTGTLGIQVAGDVMEATIKSAGRMINDLRGGGAPVNSARIQEEIGTIFADGGFVLSKLMDAGYTRELADMALKNNPRLNNLITNVGAEVETQGGGAVNDVVRTINIFNRAVDGVVRGPIFIQSVQNRMKDVGLDFEDFMANNKPVPTSLLKAAAEDTMKMTFSYSFKNTGEGGIEGTAEDLAFKTLQAVNTNAGAGIIKDFVAPFIRFQLNAVRYTYRMTPVSGFGGYQELKQAAKLRDEGKTLEAAGMAYDGKRKVLDSTVGTAAIIGAMAFREDNADVQFYQYKDEDGNVKDGSTLFPYVNIMALAEVSLVMKDVGKQLWYTVTMTPEERAAEAAKIKEQADALDPNDEKKQELTNQYESLALGRVRNFDGGKFTEIITGMGRSAGTQKTIFDTLTEVAEGGITTSMEKKGGVVVGDFISRFDNVFNPIYDAVNFLRDDMRVVDAKASTALAGQVSPGVEAAVATVAAPIPGARDLLQSRPSLFQAPEQQTPAVARQFTGTRPTPPTTAIEKELTRLNIQPYSVVKTTGSRDYDNLRIQLAAPEFRGVVTELISSPDYKAKSANEQQAAIKGAMNEVLGAYKEPARDAFLARFGQTAIDELYSKAPNKAAQEDAFVRIFKRKPSTNAEKFEIIEGTYTDIGAVGKAKGGLASRR
jgi:hypothetical protein